jgi:arylsulfatase A-like enzyme
MRQMIFMVIACLILESCASETKTNTENQEESKPNVILVITDDQGYGDVGAHGNTIIKTPHLDEFYNESFHLTDFHVGPTCAPTRSGLMTGRYANSTGVWHTVGGWSLLRENEKTMADMFVEAGYKTGAFGKWHLGDNYPFRPENRGFQETVMHGGGGVQQTPDYWNNDYFDDTYFHNGKPQKYKGYCTDVFFEEAISFIESNKAEPFFCYIATNAPHGPYNVPLAYYDLYKDLGDDVLADTQKRFYGMISNIDDNFGKLRQSLKELNVADNTILIFMTDNGTSSGYYNKNGMVTGYNADMRGTKGSQYEGGHRVPFFIHWKNGQISESRDITELTAQLDILPTLAELCGIDLPKEHLAIDGMSLVPMLRGEQSTNKRMLVTDSQRLQKPQKWKTSSVMQQNWRLIDGKELYDIKTDKGQQNDVSAQYPEKVAEMKAFYENWWTQVSIDFDEEIYFKLGNELENPITLTAHDVHGIEGGQPWSQIQIREGKTGEGYWSVEVLKDGEYEVSLRRYPIEANLPINAGIEGISDEQLPGLELDIPEGKPMYYTSASVNFGEEVKEQTNVSDTDLSAVFKVHLKPGKTKFSASFLNEQGEENIAYYVYIKKIQ